MTDSLITRTLLATDGKPVFVHDCEHCRYHGSFVVVTLQAERGANSRVYDVYTCDHTLVMRESSDGPDYVSYGLDILDMYANSSPNVAFARDMLPPPTPVDHTTGIVALLGKALDAEQAEPVESTDPQPNELWFTFMGGVYRLAVTLEGSAAEVGR